MYTESLSEQLALADRTVSLPAVTATTASAIGTGGAVDMAERHRCVAVAQLGVVGATDTGALKVTATATVTLTVAVLASSNTAFTAATVVTVASTIVTAKKVATGTGAVTATLTHTAGLSVEVSGEQVQGARAGVDDRYIKAIISIAGVGEGASVIDGMGFVLADTARYKPI